MSKRRHPPRGRLAVAAIALVTTVVAFGGMAGSAPGQQLTTINVDTLAIANGLPLTLGINKGFFAAQGLEIYGVLTAKGVPARLVYYPDENHWVLKGQNSKHWYGEVLGWLARWLK